MDMLSAFKTHTPRLITDDTCRESAVCIPFIEKEDGLHILFELRPGTMAENAGDICFPGGMLKDGETAKQAALRELAEELLLAPENIEYIGEGDVFHNLAVTVHSFAVRLKAYEGTFCGTEVKKVFTVPVRELLRNEPDSYPMEWRAEVPDSFPFERISGGRAHRFRRQQYCQYFYPSPEGWIWGITGKLLYACLQVLQAAEKQ